MMKYEIVAFITGDRRNRECAENIGRYMDGGIDVKKYPVAENCFQPAWRG